MGMVFGHIWHFSYPPTTFQLEMISVPRARPLAPNAYVLPACWKTSRLALWRPYTVSWYGGENQQESADPSSLPTKEREHPGPQPPNVSKNPPSSGARSPTSASAGPAPQPASSEPGPARGHSITQKPSNKAHPTLTDGRQSPYVDRKGNLRRNVPEDVRQHNASLESRYDRAYNKIADKGTVEKGFWTRWKSK